MKRLIGYLKGQPKVIQHLNYEWLKNQDGYVVEIVIKTVNINRQFPLISKRNKDGIREFSNQMEGETIYVDKIQLEDLIEF